MPASLPSPRRRLARRLSLLLLALLALGVSTPPVHADACASCAAPSWEEIAAQPGFPQVELPPDTYGETFAAECTYALSGEPTVSQGPAWLVLRGAGEVWTCPESSSDDTVTIEIAEGDSTSWSVTNEVSAGVKVLALSIAGKHSTEHGGGHTIHEVKRVTKSLRAAMGHRIPWSGYFEVADFTMEMEFAVTRRWSWWLKSRWTGDVVLASGSVYQGCGSEEATLTRRGSIGYKFRLSDLPCDLTTATTPTDLGWYPLPPPPPPTTPPATTPSSAPPAPATAAGPAALDEPDGDEPPGVPAYPPSSDDLGDAPTGPLGEPQGDPSAPVPAGAGS